jgi:hypothetical protein
VQEFDFARLLGRHAAIGARRRVQPVGQTMRISSTLLLVVTNPDSSNDFVPMVVALDAEGKRDTI